MTDGITVRGIPEVIHNLLEFPRLLVMGAFGKALARASAVFEEEVASRTPESDYSTSSEDMGHLIDNLMSEIEIDTAGRGGRVQIGFGKAGMKALWVEYGHRMLTHSGSATSKGEVAPHPFMRPAFEAAADRALEVFFESIREFMESGSAEVAA